MIVAVDPGLVTGLSVYDPVDRSQWSRELPAMEAADFVYNYQPKLIVCENYVPRAGVRTWQPDALHVIGALRWIAHLYHTEFVLQSAADAKRFSTDAKLDALGWRVPGLGHANDASRHLLLACIRRNLIDPDKVFQ